MKSHKKILIQSYMILSFIVLIYLPLFIFQDYTQAAEDTTSPSLTITTPTEGSYTNSSTISGTVSDDTDPATNLIIEIYENSQLIGLYDPNDEVEETITINTTGNWTFSSNFSEGIHNLEARAFDIAKNKQTKTLSFTFDKTRPTILNPLTPKGDMTKVPTNTTIGITLSDNFLILNLNVANPIILSSDTGDLAGTTVFDSTTKSITFTPSEPLIEKKTYYVYINPALADTAGNLVFPRMWKFTTIATEQVEDPHGNYTSNVNTCINCHDTHVSKSAGLETPTNYQKDPNIDNYCMACHDGTVAPPPDKHNKTKKHDFQLDPDNPKITGSCTSCHNPHLTWSDTNPNLLSDHYTYDHPNSVPPFTVDSEEQLCESCHEYEQWTVEQKQRFRDSYKVFHYRKITESTGTADDYSLCLRCHDGVKAKNIQSYYSDQNSMHRITAIDGSTLGKVINPDDPINGNIPCADCHETHGSDNLGLLNDNLGHENRKDFTTGTETQWTPAVERQFCLKCHDGSTAIYGIVGKIPSVEKSTGHETSSAEACSTCHGEGANPVEKARSAAHAPKLPVVSP